MDTRLELFKMVRETNNAFCADCGDPGPLWASWNLGVFVCVRCAAVHRKIGTHISKVKSLQLDSWTPAQVQAMSLSNNIQSRKIYEATLPDSFIRPQSDAGLEAFIRAKYEHRKFVRKSVEDNQPPDLAITCPSVNNETCHNGDLIDLNSLLDEPTYPDPATTSTSEFSSSIMALYKQSVSTSVSPLPVLPPAQVPPQSGFCQSQYLNQITQKLAEIKAQQRSSSLKSSVPPRM
ncbi:Stromal membrane-associated protein 1 [Clonorchis sinensis]|uniref:Stromal membrane-associated protein 1 n=1 Tax=Clonorchis sinensis TaxID=79923 RepID=A0A419QF47_CLOSI|nr:Stromal membrane-associated protein 1 [Clonorchis sinensis]